MAEEYIFDTDSDLGGHHMDHLEGALDGTTLRCLESIGVKDGQRCLDVGAGGGSIARWLAERVGPDGSVVAVDVATNRLAERAHPGVEVRRHDINDGLPDDRLYDVIHARLVLMHLPRREEILKALVDALAPGGWLVIGDFTPRVPAALSTPREGDEEVWDRVQHLSNGVVGPGRGVNYEWAAKVYGHMTGAGLVNVEGVERSWTITGGSPSCLLHRNHNMQAGPLLLEAGATQEELERYREMMLDPRFCAWFYQLLYTWGQKPRP